MKDVRRILSQFIYSGEKKRSRTVKRSIIVDKRSVPVFINEFWTPRQRQAHSLHEISYRACFKPQLPRFFIERLTEPGDIVYDPFSGRGTTVIEAALLGRNVIANDVNPLSALLSRPRLTVPPLSAVQRRLEHLFALEPQKKRGRIDLSMFFHARTLSEIEQLRQRLGSGAVDAWIRMVATNRLTGHSKGFFSVYTLPPNQSASPQAQKKINAARKQRPPYRDTAAIILKKSAQLLRDFDEPHRSALLRIARKAKFFSGDARKTRRIRPNSVRLTVTSPPFLNIVHYANDNWLRCWFNGIDAQQIGERITMSSTVEEWSAVMQQVFDELFRITKKGGWVAFEVGEVRNGTVRLEEHVIRLGRRSGFRCEAVMINRQRFTKTANIWGVTNNAKGTNSNRIVLFRK